MPIAPHTRTQIEDLRARLDGARPLIICDADEVLVRFVATLEAYLGDEGLYLRFDSFALTGNIRRREDDRPLDKEEVGRLLRQFFATRIADCPPVEGAAAALHALSTRADIVVLTNLPDGLRAVREAALKRLGMPYPVIANDGLKGPAVALLALRRRAPICFLDDLPPNIDSVAEDAAHVHRIHFVADPRLAALLGPAARAHCRIDSWRDTRDYLERLLAAAGH
ncbi:MAG: hypothetical protein ACOY99_02425 [Pseudomonadota bacterium]